MTKYSLLLLLSLFSLSFSSELAAQSWQRDNTGKAILVNFGYGPLIPMADLDDRFGLSWSPELSLDYITENNWTFGVQAQMMFGNDVKEDVLAALRTEEGHIIGNDRSPADIQLRQRGTYMGLRVGKLITLSENNTRSGIRINVGAGLLQHKIRIQDDPFRSVHHLDDTYKKGYDRLTNGLALYQFIGYQVIGISNAINLTAGFEFYEGFTQNRRDFNFDTQIKDDRSRVDILSGFRVSFILPFYIGNGDDIYY